MVKIPYTSMVSLKNRALVKTAITLWNRNDVQNFMKIVLSYDYDLKRLNQVYEEFERKVVENAQYLPPIPDTLKKEIIDFIPYIGRQIKYYLYHFYRIYDYSAKSLPTELCWTAEGAVERKKTAEILVKNEGFDIIGRYRLACIHCLEEYIKELWFRMPVSMKEVVFLNELGYYNEVRLIDHERDDYDPADITPEHVLVLFWTCCIKGDDDVKDFIISAEFNERSPFQFEFEHAVDHGMNVAATFFSQKLIARTKNSLVSCAEYAAERIDLNEDVLYFLLAQMNEVQQENLLKKYPLAILLCLMHWPRQRFITETTSRLWNFLSEGAFYDLLEMIVDIQCSDKEYDYQNLFEELFQQAPHTYKKFIIDDSQGCLLFSLLENEDKKNARCILNYSSAEEREKLIFSSIGGVHCERLMASNKWDSLKFFIQECVPSVDIMIKFKEKSEEYIFFGSEEKRCRFFQLIDDLIENKRKMEGYTRPQKQNKAI